MYDLRRLRAFHAVAQTGSFSEAGLELGYAPYDCFYLVSAMRRNAPFVTADKRFINRLAPTPYKSHVIHLADWT